MEINKKPWPILSVCGLKTSIDTNPAFQRPAVWNRSQKQLLIETILRDYDIPKLYRSERGVGPCFRAELGAVLKEWRAMFVQGTGRLISRGYRGGG